MAATVDNAKAWAASVVAAPPAPTANSATAVASRPAAGVVSRGTAAALASAALIWPALAGRRWGPHRFVAGIWYRLLRKPAFQPPDAAIPVAWTVIDSALAAGGYRLLRQPASTPRNWALGWWGLNVALIGGWSAMFFGRRSLPASTVLAAGMVASGVAYVAQARRVDGLAASAGVPYLGWVAFATVLTAAIWHRNR